jgi:hypothetical protein
MPRKVKPLDPEAVGEFDYIARHLGHGVSDVIA